MAYRDEILSQVESLGKRVSTLEKRKNESLPSATTEISQDALWIRSIAAQAGAHVARGEGAFFFMLIAVACLMTALYLFTAVSVRPQPQPFTPKTWVNDEARNGRWLLHERYKMCMEQMPNDDPRWWDMCTGWADSHDTADDIIHGYDHGR